MTKEEKLHKLFNHLSDELNITESMLSRAETSYDALGRYIKNHNEEWAIEVYPQGSFELGTVIKPLGEDEQYDVDLVVEVTSPDFDPETLRSNVLELLKSHGTYKGKIENKKPCIRIQYEDSAQFHMDIASAHSLHKPGTSIEIARFDGESEYYYEVSNPKGYVLWFKTAMKLEKVEKSHEIFAKQSTKVEELKLSRMRTPLQKAIQILKRHRDIFFKDRYNADDRPSSVIITTLCAKVYEDTYGAFNKDNIYLTIVNMLNNFHHYIKRNSDGEFYLENPSNPEENFLKKWNDNDKLIVAFEEWITQAKLDIITNPESFIEDNPRKLRDILIKSFGETSMENVFERYGSEVGELAEKGNLYFDKQTANIVTDSNRGKEYKPHTYFGGKKQ